MQNENWCFLHPVPLAFKLETSMAIPKGCHSQVEVNAWLL
jgi:hypothetical protein